jgi:hypothetical protein
MRLSGWVKESNGKRFISGKVEPIDQKAKESMEHQAHDLPF